MERLWEHDFTYPCQHLSYGCGNHMFVPMELKSAKFFRGGRGRNREQGKSSRMDSLRKTLEFVSKW